MRGFELDSVLEREGYIVVLGGMATEGDVCEISLARRHHHLAFRQAVARCETLVERLVQLKARVGFVRKRPIRTSRHRGKTRSASNSSAPSALSHAQCQKY